jgi:putative FmdB family regulatory protein
MPIYAYKCDACGHAKDVLQKMSDPQLTDCPSCGQATFKKQLTAAGFQLKGTGWYVTDFREGGGGKSAPAVESSSGAAETSATNAASNPASENNTSSSQTAAATATSVSAPSSTSVAPTPASAKVAAPAA